MRTDSRIEDMSWPTRPLVYVETDLLPGETLAEYRRRRNAGRRKKSLSIRALRARTTRRG